MKRERAFVDNRRKSILQTLIHSPEISVEELAKLFKVSPITIRRDLQYLEDRNMVVRYYGGAKPTDYADQLHDLDSIHIYRELIARYAATLVEDGDTIFINTSQTALGIVDYITSKNVTIITNNGRILDHNLPANINVLLTGGEIRNPKEALVGEFAERNILNVNAKKAFLGCSGISFEGGVTTENANEVKLNELMLTHTSQEAFILADHKKIGHDSSFKTCQIYSINNLITDELAPDEEIELFKEKGINVHKVSHDDIPV